MKFGLEQRLGDILLDVVGLALEVRFGRLADFGPVVVEHRGAGVGAEGGVGPAFMPVANPVGLDGGGGVDVLEAEIEPQAARDDGGQEHGGAARGEEDERVGGRFLERFQEGVGRAGPGETHPLGVEDDGDLERGHEGAQVEFPFEFADLLDGDVARFRFGPDGVEVGVVLRRGVEDLPGEAKREVFQGLGAVAGEQVGVAHAPLLDAGGKAFAEFFRAEGHGRKGKG